MGLMITSCDSFEGLGQAAVSRRGTELIMHYVPCGRETIQRVELGAQSTKTQAGLQEEVLWRIVGARVEDRPVEFEVGKAPTGFETTVAFQGLPPPRRELDIDVISSTQRYAGVSFRVKDLVDRRVFSTEGDYEDVASFERVVRADECAG